MAAACSPGDARPSLEVVDSAGVRIVRNVAAGAAVPLEPDLIVGTVDGPEELQFHGVLDLAVRDDGAILVTDRSSTVRQFSAAGEHVRSFGRRGEGPGEFSWPSGLHVYGDTIAVVDGQLDRITEFDSTGALIGTLPLSSRSRRISLVARVDGAWIARSYPMQWQYRPGQETRDTTRLVHLTPRDLAAIDVVGAPAPRTVVEYESGSAWGIAYGDGGMTVARPLWQPSRGYAIDGSGNVYVSHGLPYRIEVYDADGFLWSVIERDHQPVRVAGDLNARYWQKVDAWLDTTKASPHEMEVSAAALRGRADLPVHEHLPALGTLFVSSAGTLWAQRPDLVADPVAFEWTRERIAQDSYWDVYDHEGRFVATVQLPAAFRARAAADRSIYGVLRDDLDVQHVARFTLPADT